MLLNSAVAVAIFASYAAAQTSNSTLDPNTVDPSVRAGWCNGQYASCGYLCSGDTNSNDCVTETLAINCTCASNNSAPGLQYYIQTVPTFICQEIYERCIKANENNKAGQDVCTRTRQQNCGTLNPENFTGDAVTTSSSASATATPTASDASAASSAPTTTTSAGAAPTLAVGRDFGTGILAAGVAAAFGLML